MVKSNGFTLIEIMIVIAIIGILSTLVIGPVKDVVDSRQNNSINTEETEYEGMVMIINGIRHTCDANGDCTPIE